MIDYLKKVLFSPPVVYNNLQQKKELKINAALGGKNQLQTSTENYNNKSVSVVSYFHRSFCKVVEQ